MLKKKKFKPVITRVKLNPEQAVLTCKCYNVNAHADPGLTHGYPPACFVAGMPKQVLTAVDGPSWVALQSSS